MPQNANKRPSPSVSLVSGGIAGGVEAFCTYPFELVKSRVQLRQAKDAVLPRNPYKLVAQIYSQEGLSALYRGCSALVVGSFAKDASRFLTFDKVKDVFKDPVTGTLSPGRNLLAGMFAGIVASCTAVTPSERIKTALIDDARRDKLFTGNLHAIRTIYAEDGLVGFYRGFAGTTMKQAGATAFRMGSYNILKDYQTKYHIRQNVFVNFANGAAAGVITTLATQPFDCIKTRSQSAKRTTTVEAINSIWADGGITAFWRGTVMRLSRTVLAGGILFTTAEAVSKVVTPILT